MKYLSKYYLFACLILASCHSENSGIKVISTDGQQPDAAVNNKNIISVTYGENDSIFYVQSDNNGRTFSSPILAGYLANMHLGNTRGPQIAASSNYTLIAAINKAGDIHTFRLDLQNEKWLPAAIINDVPGAAGEGLMSLAADDDNHFYAVWLDHRKKKGAEIYFAKSMDGGNTWEANQLIYHSPDTTVCECCRPAIAARDGKIAIQFRNNLKGSRDLYLSISTDGGATFSAAQKLGNGTWKLNACPMDGGGVAVDEQGEIHTAWKRNNLIYTDAPNQPETPAGTGRKCAMAQDGSAIAWQQKNEIWLKPENKKAEAIGKGSFPCVVALHNNKLLALWEDNGEIKAAAVKK